jgi:hypothetical protein
MFSVIMAAVLSQAPVMRTPFEGTVVAPVADTTISGTVVTMHVLTSPPDVSKDTKKTVKNDERADCVEQTGSRIKRHDKATCNNGRTVTQEDIERTGGQFLPFKAPETPLAAGH